MCEHTVPFTPNVHTLTQTGTFTHRHHRYRHGSFSALRATSARSNRFSARREASSALCSAMASRIQRNSAEFMSPLASRSAHWGNGKSYFCQNRCAVITSIRLPTHTTCSVGVMDNILSRGCDGFDRSTGRLHVRSRRFFRADVDPDTARRDDRGGLW